MTFWQTCWHPHLLTHLIPFPFPLLVSPNNRLHAAWVSVSRGNERRTGKRWCLGSSVVIGRWKRTNVIIGSWSYTVDTSSTNICAGWTRSSSAWNDLLALERPNSVAAITRRWKRSTVHSSAYSRNFDAKTMVAVMLTS